MDRDKVIKGLEVCLKNIDQQDCPNDCPYLSDCSKYENRVVFQPLMRDALALLKEQEAQKFFVDDSGKITPIPVVVRCKDCRHCTFSDGEQLADCMIKQGWFPVKPDWFCADGERK